MNLAALLNTMPVADNDAIIDGLRRRIAAYSPDEARDNHGRWAKSGTQLELPLAPDIKKFHTAVITKAVKDVAKRLGFPVSKLIISDKDNKVAVDGQTGSASGVYDSRKQTITIYPKQIADAEEAKAVIAHEIQHHVFNMVSSAARNNSDSGIPESPIFTKLTTLMSDAYTLAKEDGVSPYSRMYWEGVLNHTVPLSLAVNETLGEIAFLDEKSHGPITKDVNDDLKGQVGKHWRALYSSFAEAYATLPKTKSKKIGAAVERGVVDGKVALIAPFSARLLRVLFIDGGSAFVTRASLVQAYSPDEPRDEKGRWTTGGNEIFVSPNIEENLGLQDAIRFLSSDRQTRFETKARDIVSEVVGKGTVKGAVGVWADGAENSTAVSLPQASTEQLGYVASLLGKAASQKAVLAWERASEGPHVLYKLATGKNPKEIAADAAKQGIAFQTITPGKINTVEILDQDGSLADKVEALGALSGYRPVNVQRGTGNFIGSWTSREEGVAAYDKIIQDYEKTHSAYKGSLQFSARLQSSDRRENLCGRGASSKEVVAAYNPDEPRDKNGEWTSSGVAGLVVTYKTDPAHQEYKFGFVDVWERNIDDGLDPQEAAKGLGVYVEAAARMGITPQQLMSGMDNVSYWSIAPSHASKWAVAISKVISGAKDADPVMKLHYDVTQALLKQRYPRSSSIRLFRGEQSSSAANVLSWTDSKSVAETFAGKDGHVTARKVPFASVFSTYVTSPSLFEDTANEREWIISASIAAYSPDEARDKNGEWTDGGQSRADTAKRTYNPATFEKQKIADEAEQRLSKAIGVPRTKNNSPFDLVGIGIAIEVKTLVDRKRDEITMHPDSLRRKQKEARKTKVNAYTVVLDERPGKQQVYWKAGVGSFTLTSMHTVASVRILRKVLTPR